MWNYIRCQTELGAGDRGQGAGRNAFGELESLIPSSRGSQFSVGGVEKWKNGRMEEWSVERGVMDVITKV